MLRPPPHPLLASLFEGVWAAPWMLLWLPAVGLPFLISRWMAGPPTVVRWGPIDILARARRRIGANASGSPLSLLLIRSALVALTVVAAARPLFPRPTMDRTAADPTKAATGDPTTAGRIILVAPSTGGRSKADGGPSSNRRPNRPSNWRSTRSEHRDRMRPAFRSSGLGRTIWPRPSRATCRRGQPPACSSSPPTAG